MQKCKEGPPPLQEAFLFMERSRKTVRLVDLQKMPLFESGQTACNSTMVLGNVLQPTFLCIVLANTGLAACTCTPWTAAAGLGLSGWATQPGSPRHSNIILIFSFGMRSDTTSVVLMTPRVSMWHSMAGLQSSAGSLHAGDWFNRLDYSGQTNNFGVGLPVATKNRESWPLKQPLLANPSLKPSLQLIQACKQRFLTLLRIRCLPPSAVHCAWQNLLPINCCWRTQDQMAQK